MRLSQVIEEDNGKLSFSRTLSAIVVLTILGLIAFNTFRDGKIPDLGGPTLFLTGSVAALYGSNKVANAIQGKPTN